MKQIITLFAGLALLAGCCGNPAGPLPRGNASEALQEAFAQYLQAVQDSSVNMHSIMVLQHGKVLAEKQIAPDTAHIMNSGGQNSGHIPGKFA